MLKKPFGSWLMLAAILVLPVLALSQAAQQNRTLSVAGHLGEIPILEMNGRAYVEVEALAHLTNGSLGFNGNQILLTLPASAAGTPPASQPPAAGFSRDFLRAGIEQMAVIREWRSALINVVQQSLAVTEEWTGPFQRQALQNLRLASVAASTDADRSAMHLLTNEFNSMKQLSDRFVQARKSMSYISPNSLDNDPLDQRIVKCGHSLAAMAASGQFVDDGSCQ